MSPTDPRSKPYGRPGAAAAGTDAESGTENPELSEEKRKSLYALKVMFERGLLPKAEYEARRAALEGKQG